MACPQCGKESPSKWTLRTRDSWGYTCFSNKVAKTGMSPTVFIIPLIAKASKE